MHAYTTIHLSAHINVHIHVYVSHPVLTSSCEDEGGPPALVALEAGPPVLSLWWCDVVISSMRPTMSVVEMPSVRGMVRYLPAHTEGYMYACDTYIDTH
jgi:hypothetical protein